MNEIAEMIRGKAKPTPVTRTALKAADAVSKKIRELAEEGATAKRIALVRDRAMLAAQKLIFDTIESEKARLSNVLNNKTKEWNADADRKTAKRAFALDAARVKFLAMEPDELVQSLERMSGGELTGDPIIVDAAIAAARANGVDPVVVRVYRQKLVERGYDKPWRHDEKGRELTRELAMLSNVEPGTVPVEIGDGIAAFDLADLLDDVSESEGEE